MKMNYTDMGSKEERQHGIKRDYTDNDKNFIPYDVDANEVVALLEIFKSSVPSAKAQINYAIQAVKEKAGKESID